MRWSDERILTTHTGSLPRPPELTRLYVRRARGEAIDRAELDRVGKAALRRIVDKQIEAGRNAPPENRRIHAHRDTLECRLSPGRQLSGNVRSLHRRSCRPNALVGRWRRS
jgi:methionine synthase II (cobalamin-independent)